MQFNHIVRTYFTCEDIFEDSFFLSPNQDMPDEFKGLEINILDQDIEVYDNLVQRITLEFEHEGWILDPKNEDITIGDYCVRSANDIKKFDHKTYWFLVNAIDDFVKINPIPQKPLEVFIIS